MNAPDHYLYKQIQVIVVLEIPIARIEDEYKPSQNRTNTEQANMIDQLSRSQYPMEVEPAKLMVNRYTKLA